MKRNLYCTPTRPKAFWGAVISAAANIAGSLINGAEQKKAAQQQKIMEDYQNAVQTANSTAQAVNQSRAAEEHYQEQFRQPYAKGGLRKRRSRLSITDGGVALPIDNNTFLLRGGSHQDVNETGQTGIGLNIDGQEIEGENNEIVQNRHNDVRIFSDRLVLPQGETPAQAVLNGEDKNKVFAQQEAIKKILGYVNGTGRADLGDIVIVQPRRVSYRNPNSNLSRAGNRNNWWDYLTDGRLRQFNTIYNTNGDSYEVNPVSAFFRGTAIGDGKKLVANRPKAALGSTFTYNGKRYTIDGIPLDDNGNPISRYYDDLPGGRQTWMNDYGNGVRGYDIDPNGDGAVVIGSKMRERLDTPVQQPTAEYRLENADEANPITVGQSRRDRMGMIVKGGDWIGLGTDLIGSLAAGWLNRNAAKRGYYTPDRPGFLQAAKLNTTYNINPQLADNERQRIATNNAIARDTMSSAASLARQGVTNTNATSTLNQLYAEKENKENEYINADALNQQEVAAKNIQLQQDWQDKVSDIRNKQAEAKARAGQITLQGIAGAANNFLGQTMQRYEDVQALKAYAAASPEGTAARLIASGLDDTGELSDAVIRQYATMINTPLTPPIKGTGESNEDFAKRVAAYNDEVKERRMKETEFRIAQANQMRTRRGRRMLSDIGFGDMIRYTPYMRRV